MHCMIVGVASSVHRAAVTGQFGCTGDTCAVVGVDVGVPPVKVQLLGHGHQYRRVFTIPAAGYGRSTKLAHLLDQSVSSLLIGPFTQRWGPLRVLPPSPPLYGVARPTHC